MDNPLLWRHRLPDNISPGTPEAAFMQAQSLTAALRGLNAVFSVHLLHLGNSGFDPLFSDGLINSGTQNWFARDVLLCLNGKPVVWARSLCRQTSANWRSLLDCGTRPLGERLFDGSLPLTRSPFEYTALPPRYPLAGFDGYAVAARRSLFRWQGETLGLAECFLPALQSFVQPADGQDTIRL
ncbi:MULTISPECIES: chorismate lyase [Neisseria]|uniref:Chorismate lyase family protein n=1 Tax=Neisseria musculi TaxID=1815583 RepID=A0A7H1MC41_9NEIS|nr:MULTISPECIES: chorismate lyase [Neisseria]MBF0804526.1 chorismate lyase [Neisseria sp. 19428wB4_WF04]QNT59206.1 chorismate lyase family protein [Neisseria musculi]TFU40467.1 chorismate lyase [Neisseria sp. WF04]